MQVLWIELRDADSTTTSEFCSCLSGDENGEPVVFEPIRESLAVLKRGLHFVVAQCFEILDVVTKLYEPSIDIGSHLGTASAM